MQTAGLAPDMQRAGRRVADGYEVGADQPGADEGWCRWPPDRAFSLAADDAVNVRLTVLDLAVPDSDVLQSGTVTPAEDGWGAGPAGERLRRRGR